MITFNDFCIAAHGEIVSFHHDSPLTTIITDSRKASKHDGAVFFAIKGSRHDGHAYIQQLYAQGIRQFVVEQLIPTTHLAGANIVKVTSAVGALQNLAQLARQQFSIPIIGITGSNGKTIIKEWLFQMLSKELSVVKNPGSYNSQIGVPLSVWQIQQHHKLGIFEAGISKPGEMEKLQAIIKPTIGIFTNIGSAHDEGFNDVYGKIDEKLKLFSGCEAVIHCIDHRLITEAFSSLSIKTFTWGKDKHADLRIEVSSKSITVFYNNQINQLTLPFSDPASLENCMHCVALMVYLKYSFHDIQERINGLRAVPMRLELKEGINHCQIIDDSYNNDLGGIEISLQFLSHQNQKKKKRFILSDVLETGQEEASWVNSIKVLLAKNSIQSFVGIGESLTRHKDKFAPDAKFYPSTEAFLQQFPIEQLQDEVILIKGSRRFHFEDIVNKLQRKVHGTVMEIDLGALVNNLNYFKTLLRPSTKLMVMVKAFAYGSGSNEVANLLQYHRADYLGVAYTDEGVELRKSNISLPIMVMNPSEDSFDQIMSFNLEPEVYNFKILNSLINHLNGRDCNIHIKIDTGMHRLGFEEEDQPLLLKTLIENPNIKVKSAFSHLAGADEQQHDEFSRQQAEKFLSYADHITNSIGYKPLYHILNSPGILRLQEYQMDMVRLGIGLYGIDPTADTTNNLKPVASLKTIISQIKKVKKGETIGYGRRGEADRDITLGTIALGYADGYSRAFSRGVGEVLVNGKRAKVIGNVCMDMTMIDLTDIEAQEGDFAIIFGEGLPIQEVASKINTIPYEILTNSSERVKRVFVAESI